MPLSVVLVPEQIETSGPAKAVTCLVIFNVVLSESPRQGVLAIPVSFSLTEPPVISAELGVYIG